jgi:hypothetical protein
MSAFNQLIQAGGEDGYWNVYGSHWWNVTSAYLTVGQGSDDIIGFFRFTNIPIAQGGTIDSAYVHVWTHDYGSSNDVNLMIRAVDEDNTAAFPSSNGYNTDPGGRARTSAGVTMTVAGTRGVETISGDIKTVIQEVVDRVGWSGGNAMAIVLEDNGSTYANDLAGYEFSTTKCMELIINYTSISTYTKTVEANAYIIKDNTDYGVKITKPTYDVKTDTNPSHFIFDSQYGTLKYHYSGSVQLDILVLDGGIAGSISYDHNLGYIPYVEVYTQNPIGEYEYCPTFGSGASTTWYITYKVTTTQIVFYAEEGGFEDDISFILKFFIFKNNLNFG